MSAVDSIRRAESRRALWQNELVRSIILQVIVAGALLALVLFFVHNTSVNLQKRGIASGFGFLDRPAGFDISISLVPYTMQSSYSRAFVIGLLNTLLISAIGIVLATLIGVVVGIARLSRNFLVAKLAAVYVDVIRNIPLLVQIIFWYFGVLTALPGVRQSLNLFHLDLFFVNSRGLYMPKPLFGPGSWLLPVSLLVGVAAAIAVSRWARRRQELTGRPFPTVSVGLGLIIGLPLLLGFTGVFHISWSVPQLKGFNFAGGMDVLPEFVALLLALSIYTAAFIAEIVRSGIQAVSHGQTEAAYALGLKPTHTTRLVILPQALRVIIPPLSNQYLNLTKNSSLAVVIGYPELVSVFMGTVLNQTGQAVEVIAITMAVYLAISLVISAFMNWYNRRIALVER
ncbi:MAG: ral L-amino acid transport system permease protein [Rhodospirillaceae bacterium]|nr:ral L-amino acid transport system permease protein [Rhodospirillaceae bacterium]